MPLLPLCSCSPLCTRQAGRVPPMETWWTASSRTLLLHWPMSSLEAYRYTFKFNSIIHPPCATSLPGDEQGFNHMLCERYVHMLSVYKSSVRKTAAIQEFREQSLIIWLWLSEETKANKYIKWVSKATQNHGQLHKTSTRGLFWPQHGIYAHIVNGCW